MKSHTDLDQKLKRIDGKGYKSYKDIAGAYTFDDFTLYIDHVQGDPFATPSKVRVRTRRHVRPIPSTLHATPIRRMALEDFLAREVRRSIRGIVRGHRGTGKGGLVTIDAGGQQVLERTAVVVTGEWREARLHVGLPAEGRRVRGGDAREMLLGEIPRLVAASLLWSDAVEPVAREFVSCIENQEHIRRALADLGLVAFIADGSILPRESGASNRPLPRREAIPFASPESLRIRIELPNPQGDVGTSHVTGMGIPVGVTLIVGGGYHGKSTLLHAVERAVYPHIPGDGRERVVTVGNAVKIRAEDGRRVERVDISPFIGDLPYGRRTTDFATDDASGSTSQAATIMEAVEVGASALLLDEDTSATNFMVRDARMQALVSRTHEPITPFLDRVRELYDILGISTVLVMGGSGDYFDAADTVIMMRDYVPSDATADARRVASSIPTRRARETVFPLGPVRHRIPLREGLDASRGRREVKIGATALDILQFGRQTVDLRGVEQLVDISQTRAIAHVMYLAAERYMDGKATFRETLDAIDAFFDERGLDPLDPYYREERHPGDFARPRRFEIAAALNRLRTLRCERAD